jgi:hypothetical protein
VVVVVLLLAVVPLVELVALVEVVLQVGAVVHLLLELLTQEVAVAAAARLVTTELVEQAAQES